ncbi:MAG: YjhG/YagF family D-xylonate dehydratase, partial [Planctomycetaceae bacterium]|nr:YjhG/YagF family D-xylonate dehydratase [Planctomycetaceae bacterium]
VDLVGDGDREFTAEEGHRILQQRETRAGLKPDIDLPGDTRLWAALQNAGGGTWGGCVYDIDRILEVLAAGEKALEVDGQD